MTEARKKKHLAFFGREDGLTRFAAPPRRAETPVARLPSQAKRKSAAQASRKVRQAKINRAMGKAAEATRERRQIDHWYGDDCDLEGSNPGHVEELLQSMESEER